MKEYQHNPIVRAAILDQLPRDLPAGNKAEKPRSVIVGSRGQPLVFDRLSADETSEVLIVAELPPPGDTGEESISAQEEIRMACAWLMSLGEDDAAGALAVIRTLREGWTP